MYLGSVWALAACCSTVIAFKDTSPFFFFSTSEILASPPQIVSSETLRHTLISSLSKCPSDTYVVVSQPGVDAEDYKSSMAAPRLKRRMSSSDQTIRSSFSVSDVLGDLDPDMLMAEVEDKCEASLLSVDASTGSFPVIDDLKPRVIRLEFPPLSGSTARRIQLSDNDAFLSSLLDLLPSQRYTVIYTTSPATSVGHTLQDESTAYKMESTFPSSLHLDLKRDFAVHGRASGENITLPHGALFERYQFLTPGIIMGLLIGLILLYILYLGINGVASLQVSYAAFDREMGPAAQKKQQQ